MRSFKNLGVYEIWEMHVVSLTSELLPSHHLSEIYIKKN